MGTGRLFYLYAYLKKNLLEGGFIGLDDTAITQVFMMRCSG